VKWYFIFSFHFAEALYSAMFKNNQKNLNYDMITVSVLPESFPILSDWKHYKYHQSSWASPYTILWAVTLNNTESMSWHSASSSLVFISGEYPTQVGHSDYSNYLFNDAMTNHIENLIWWKEPTVLGAFLFLFVCLFV
jgi:hypothetical protein